MNAGPAPQRFLSRFLPLLLLLWPGLAAAQLTIEFTIERRLYVRYEPVIVEVTITNLAGREIVLRDDAGQPWFGFEIVRADGSIVAPANTDYKLSPLTVGAGEAIKRRVDLAALYDLTEFGFHKIRAWVFFADRGQMFNSRFAQIDITEGKTLWKQTVGVPEGLPGAGSIRTFSLLQHRLPDGTRLYARVQDPDTGTVYATTEIGRMVSLGNPVAKLDASNELHILHSVAPKTYLYTRFGLDGDLQARSTYLSANNSTPKLQRLADGTIQVVGGMLDVPAPAPANQKVPKLSDRPVPLPRR